MKYCLGKHTNSKSKFRRWLNDRSRRVGGWYFGKLPYKGYNRFRSQSWNISHTLK